MNARFWNGKRVLVTGNTGFKGSWLSLWLQKLGATTAGYALVPQGPETLFEQTGLAGGMQCVYADIRDRQGVEHCIRSFRPEIVFHLAAQPLVRRSYVDPIETYEVNVMGTAYLLEALRNEDHCRAVIIITSDKCYENREWPWGYRESDPLGGNDPYSSSKGCAELVTSAYRHSFFGPNGGRRLGVASARAGNVIGGGDFAKDRLVPDVLAAIRQGNRLQVRYPDAIRPWQHVLEPLAGYLLLAQRLFEDSSAHSQGWNFGPPPSDSRSVRWVVERLCELMGRHPGWQIDTSPKPHEAGLLTLDSAKARMLLGWSPRWTLEDALRAIVSWEKAREAGARMRETTLAQIAAYESVMLQSEERSA